MTTDEVREDRALGISLFVRAQERGREQTIAWMRAEGFYEASAAVAWERSAERYRALFRRSARRDLAIGATALGSAAGASPHRLESCALRFIPPNDPALRAPLNESHQRSSQTA